MLTHLLGTYGYAALVVLLLLGGMGVPVSEDVTLLTAAVLAANRVLTLPLVLGLGYAGVVAGDLLIYGWGRRLGPRALRTPRIRRFVTPKREARVRELFSRWGVLAVVVGRHTPGLRPVVFFLAGTERLALWKFALADALSAGLTVPLVVLLGYKLGGKLGVENLHGHIVQIELAVGGAVVLATVAWWLVSRRRRRAGPASP